MITVGHITHLTAVACRARITCTRDQPVDHRALATTVTRILLTHLIDHTIGPLQMVTRITCTDRLTVVIGADSLVGHRARIGQTWVRGASALTIGVITIGGITGIAKGAIPTRHTHTADLTIGL